MKTLILGFDAFDPRFFERLSGQGQLPNLTRYLENQGYARFEVANPPQSEVSWTSIATGLNPGHHGVFDFVHRDPQSYTPYVSLLPSAQKIGGLQFVRPSNAVTIFDQAVKQGYPATSLWWPATFPARPESPVCTLPGLGTPDIHGRLGVGTLYSTDPELSDKQGKTPVRQLQSAGQGRYQAEIVGPSRSTRAGPQAASQDLELLLIGDQAARLKVGSHTIDLTTGEWSPIFEIRFKMGWFISVRAITRVILTATRPHLNLYFLPLQLHPLNSPWRYGTPGSFVSQAWKTAGPFLTLGWPQDTTGLEDGCINDDQFLDLCESIFASRVHILFQELQRFEEGLLASVFDTLDRVQHMFWKSRPDIVENWYRKLDRLVGEVEKRLGSHPSGPVKIVVVSDHGFADFNHKIHLNRWLIDHGYLQAKLEAPSGDLKDVDWSRTQAYALGLNSLFLNLAGREGAGLVQPTQREEILAAIRQKLAQWRGPGGKPVVSQTWGNRQAFEGQNAALGPDLVIGYSSGFRASSQTGLGAWEPASLEPNRDHWQADHCIDPEAVPGVIFSNHPLTGFSRPSYRDIPAITIGAQPDTSGSPPPQSLTTEESETIEERLKSLGYL